MSRVQFNLLPDVKLDYMRTRRSRNLVIIISALAVIISATILILLLVTVEVVQKNQLKSTKTSLSSADSQLSNISNLNKIVTVQNQLTTLVGLHQKENVTSRIFTYLQQLTPSKAHISRVNLDLTQNTIELAGSADNQQTVNTFVDTLKFTTYKVGSQDTPHPAFSSVVESNFSINTNDVSYTIDMSLDPKLFSNSLLDSQGHAQTPVLSVPSLTTTRSAIDDPSNALFQKASDDKGTQ